jgi:hypothetical protein
MSLVGLALRTAAVEALKGKTWAGPLVFDQAGQIGDTTENVPQFAIVVETASEDGQTIGLTFSIALYQRLRQDARTIIWGVPFSSPEAERALDAIGSQIVAALAVKDRGWADAFRSLRVKDGTTRIIASGPPDGKAARCITYWIDAVAKVTDDFVNELDASPELAAVKAAFTAAPDWAALGLNGGEPVEVPKVKRKAAA